MATQRDSNYLINISCPHCGAKIVAAVSGFAGELALRNKTCQKCNRDYYLQILAVPSATMQVTDGDVASLRHRIKWLKAQKERDLATLLSKSAMYEKIYSEALAMAKKMYEKRSLN